MMAFYGVGMQICSSGVPQLQEIWRSIWLTFKEEKINQFLWQIAYRILATKHYVYSHRLDCTVNRDEIVLRNDKRTWCDRCPLEAHEDLWHLLWDCPESIQVWRWVEKVMKKVGHINDHDLHITSAHALLGATFMRGNKEVPQKLWQIIRGHAAFEIWKSKDSLVMDRKNSSAPSIIASVWANIRAYFSIEWKALMVRVSEKEISMEEAQKDFTLDFGDEETMYTVSGKRLRVAYAPTGIT